MARRQRDGIDRNALLTLHALLRERSVSGAAQSLFLSQQAVSGALVRLREHYGDQLLERDGRGHRLTPFGEELLNEADAAVAVVDDALRPVSQLAAAETDRSFSIVASDVAMAVLAGPLIAALDQRAPNATVTFEPYTGGDMADPAELLVHDAVIAPAQDAVPGRSRPVLEDELVCIVAPDRVTARDGAGLETLRGLRYVAASRQPHADELERVFDEAGIGIVASSTSVAGILALPLLVQDSEVFAVVPSRIAAEWNAAGAVAIVDVPLALPRVSEAVFWHPSRDEDASVRSLVRWIIEVAEAVSGD